MSWIIRNESVTSWSVEDGSDAKGRIEHVETEVWRVRFFEVSSLTADLSSYERAVGYVRGVEAATRVYRRRA